MGCRIRYLSSCDRTRWLWMRSIRYRSKGERGNAERLRRALRNSYEGRMRSKCSLVRKQRSGKRVLIGSREVS